MAVSDATPPTTAIGTRRARTSAASRLVTLTAVLVPTLGVLSAAGILWGVAFRPVDAVLFAVFYVLPGLGITVGFHRLFSHKSFKSGPVVRGTHAILGSMTLQGPVTQWVTDHRRHHAMSDKPGDPHSPHGHRDGLWGGLAGLWHSHMGWLFTTKGMERDRVYGKDLYDDPLIRWIDRLYFVWVALSLGIPFAVGYIVGGGSLALGFEAFVWAGLVRIFLFDHITWSVNSICHSFGRRDYDTSDESRNVAVLAIPTMGEAWHNNHHAFPGSAVHGLGRRQIDISAGVIRLLEKAGLVWDVKRPTEERLARRARTA